MRIRTKQAKEWIELVHKIYESKFGIHPPTLSRIRLTLHFYFGNRKRDVDNCCKIMLDSLNKFAFADDEQIDELMLKKCYGNKEQRTEIFIEEIESDKNISYIRTMDNKTIKVSRPIESDERWGFNKDDER